MNIKNAICLEDTMQMVLENEDARASDASIEGCRNRNL